MANERAYDVVVFGATGFTGRLSAEYLAEKSKTTKIRWAIAGRSRAKLEGVKRALDAVHPGVEILEARADDPVSLDRMASAARVVLTTVGPYAEHGEPLVAACVRAGTDYVDITGEPEFVDGLLERHDGPARDRGVRIVNCCGFDSVPHDLGVLFTLRHLPPGTPLTVEAFVRASGTFSGGTWASAIGAMSRLRASRGKARRPVPTAGRKVAPLRAGVHYEKRVSAWACPMPTIDPQIVLRSAAALDAYGPDFRYGHYLPVSSAFTLAGGAIGLGAVVGLAQWKPTRDLLLRVRASGEGPSAEKRARSRFSVTFLAEGGGVRVTTRVSGGDPGYGETAKMIAESALTLALDRALLPAHFGVLTPAVALGDPLLARLEAAQIRFSLLEKT